jgi:histidinol dehydrogenase
MPDIRLIELAGLGAAERDALLLRAEADVGPILDKVRAIVEAVRAEGDAALLRFARDFDRAEIPADGLRARDEDFARAEAALGGAVKEAIRYAIDGIRRFHQHQRPAPMWLEEIRPGAFAGERTTAIPSVACYVPRGKGAFPSVTMMTTIPAVVAGVKRIVVLTPPGPDGAFDAATLFAAREAGVSEIYRVGGAQAVAAAAFGTLSVPRVCKIVGPGSSWVVAAKTLLADRIDTGLPAGPSESIVLADGAADVRNVALDLLNEAEHGPDSSAYLVTPDRALALAVRAELPGLLARLGAERAGFATTVLSGPRGGILVARDMEGAIAFANAYAPEHLMLHVAEPFALLGRLEHAGEILLGANTPICVANYLLGPNCVLPTGGFARSFSPLSVHDFMKRTSIGYVTAAGYAEPARHARTLARYEGFEAHALAVSHIRRTPDTDHER